MHHCVLFLVLSCEACFIYCPIYDPFFVCVAFMTKKRKFEKKYFECHLKNLLIRSSKKRNLRLNCLFFLTSPRVYVGETALCWDSGDRGRRRGTAGKPDPVQLHSESNHDIRRSLCYIVFWGWEKANYQQHQYFYITLVGLCV